MELKIIEQDDRQVKFKVEGISAETANAIRRSMAAEVPVMAVESLDIVENNSGLVDEVLAHRIGLIPLVWPDRYNVRAKCTCKGRGCSNCTVELALNAAGPKVVRASDLESDDKNVHPLDGNTIIVELLEAQKVELTCIAQLGYGKDHAKWQAAVVGYDEKGKSFTFKVESVSGLTASEVVKRALDELAERASEFAKAVKKEL